MYVHTQYHIDSVLCSLCLGLVPGGGSTSIRKDTQSSVNENELLYRAIV